MSYEYISLNGRIVPADQAVISLDNIEYAYGFGVYETVRVSHGVVYFAREHAGRLMRSAEALSLEHPFSAVQVETYLRELVQKLSVEACNLKILLLGAPTQNQARLYILPLNPLFPDRKLYRDGVACITYRNERLFPHAKSLNMLPSYLAYREAKRAGAYEALLINNHGSVTEGTRTNFFCIKDRVITSPPEDEILLGVMRKVVLKVALENGFKLEQKSIPLETVAHHDGAFITSTSSKLLPIRSIDGQNLPALPDSVRELSTKVNQFLSACQGLLDQA